MELTNTIAPLFSYTGARGGSKGMMTNSKILIIDEDKYTTHLLAEFLMQERYEVTVANDAEQGLIFACSHQDYDAILLDVMQPKTDGYMLLKTLRETHTTPVIMLTENKDEYERVFGLELGADDCMIKPVSKRELVARIKALLRRVSYDRVGHAISVLKIGPIILDNRACKVSYDSQCVELTGREFSILQLLMVNQGRVINKGAISLAAFGRPLEAYDRSIDMHVSNLRKKFALYAGVEIIRTVRGSGYMFVEQWEG